MAREGSLGVRAAVEASSIVGSTAATTAATGENGFTFEAMLQNVLMNRLGGVRDAVMGGPAAGAARGATARRRPRSRRGATARRRRAPARRVRPRRRSPAAGRRRGRTPPRPMRCPRAPRTLPRVLPGPIPPGPPAMPRRPAARPGPRPRGRAARGPVRPAGAAERLEARGMWRGMEQVASEWPGMTDPGRRARLADVANPLLAARDIPSVTVVKDPPQRAGEPGRVRLQAVGHPDRSGPAPAGGARPKAVAQLHGARRATRPTTRCSGGRWRGCGPPGAAPPRSRSAWASTRDVAQQAFEITKRDGR